MSRPQTDAERLPGVLILGPDRSAISGVSTHLNLLFDCGLASRFLLRHFQVGSEGRGENVFSRLLRLAGSPFVLAATLLAGRIDVMHVNTSLNRRAYWRDFAYMLVARLCGVPVLCQVHGGNLRRFSAAAGFFAPPLHAMLRLPDIVVVLSHSELESWRQLVPGQPVLHLPNAIDPRPYLGLERPPPAGRPLQLLYIGRLCREKGLYEALNGLRLAQVHGVTAQLTIAGSGPEAAALRNKASQLGLERQVRFVGPVFGDAKPALLAHSDVLLLPSYSEGLPYALLECMAAGMPAIVTPVGAIPDVVIEDQHGIFVPPHDVPSIARAIARLATDPGLVARMGAASRQRVAGAYSMQRLTDEFTRLYAEFAAPRCSSAASRP
ncbi:MAG TPA: glycosyltransferase family 4 protein [Azonexus sp.]|nr:glycosyltransferase family 4 protein [Azonexus sp.]